VFDVLITVAGLGLLGVAAIICPLPVQNSTVVSEIPFSVSAAILLGFLANAALFTSKPELSISQLDGAIMLAFFLLFMVYVFSTSRPGAQDSSPAVPVRSVTSSVIFVLLGVAGLFLGGEWVVEGAVGLARSWEVNDALIGLTIVAIGTSLPELTASAVAAYRKQPDIAVGNVVGSNIFNILWILGLTSSLTTLPFDAISNIDIIMVVVSSMLILLAVATSRTATITRGYGIAFVTLYLGYLAYLIQRG
jgi:cation:H+ antiporter